MKRLGVLSVVLVLLPASLLSACGAKQPPTVSFVPSTGVTALAGTSDGGLRYGKRDGTLFVVDKDGKGSTTPIATVGRVDEHGVVGLAIDAKDRTFASYLDRTTEFLTISQVTPGPVRVVYQGTTAAVGTGFGGLAVSPQGRLLVTSADRILSIDPDGASTQPPNVVSAGWNKLGGIAFASGGVLWAIDGSLSDAGRIARATDIGPTGKATDTDQGQPSSMVNYGDSEFAICFSGTHHLQRYYISDGVQALSGRLVASDCTGDVTILKDGRLAYTTTSEIRVNKL